MKAAKIRMKAFAAIRRNEWHAWIDTKTISGSREATASSAASADIHIPGWARDNPVVGIEEIVIETAGEVEV